MKNIISKSFIYILLVVGFTSISSCKKKKDEDNTYQNSSTNNPSVVVNSEGGYYGLLTTRREESCSFQNDTLIQYPGTEFYSANAIFSSQPFEHYGFLTGTDVDAGYVKIDSLFLNKYIYSYVTYFNQSATPLYLPQEWKIDGSAFVPQFTFNNPDTIPVFYGLDQIPDTIHTSQGLSMQLIGLSGCDEVVLNLTTNFGHFEKHFVASTSAQIEISSNELSSLGADGVSCYWTFAKNNYFTSDGKAFKFQTVLRYYVVGVVTVP